MRIVSVAALPRKYRRDAVPPEALDRGQDARLVIDQYIMLGWKTALDIVERLLFVDIYEYPSVDRVGQAGPLDFAGLKEDVAIGQNDGVAERFSRFNTSKTDGNSRSANG